MQKEIQIVNLTFKCNRGLRGTEVKPNYKKAYLILMEWDSIADEAKPKVDKELKKCGLYYSYTEMLGSTNKSNYIRDISKEGKRYRNKKNSPSPASSEKKVSYKIRILSKGEK
jgi:hypothetical protein